MTTNYNFYKETEMCSNDINFDFHVRLASQHSTFINFEVVNHLHYRLSNPSAHKHIVEVWFDDGFWVNHINNDIKFFVGNFNELRSALEVISNYCY